MHTSYIYKTLIVGIVCACCNFSYAQRRLVEEVKQDMNTLSLSIDSYKNALNKLKPALTNEETKNEAETWFVAGKIAYGRFDKFRSLKAIGQKVDEHAMGNALLDGYDYMQNALKHDTIEEKDKKGNVKINKKTGKAKLQTKFSKDIVKIISNHYNDYKLVGRLFYVTSHDFGKSYKAWDVYTSLPYDERYRNLNDAATDSVIGEYRFYQGIAAKLDGNYKEALDAFDKALKLGYNKKDVFDYAISCAEHEKDDSTLVNVVKDAFMLYGKDDSRYIGILFNYAITNKKYDIASKIIDQAIADYPDNAEYYDLKGVLLEAQTGKIDSSYQYFKKAVELDADFIKANFDMGRYYYNMALREKDGEKAKDLFRIAMPYLEKTYSKEPNNSLARDALRVIYYNLNDAEKLERLSK